MDVSIIVPVPVSGWSMLPPTLDAIGSQRYGLGTIEVFVVGYGEKSPDLPAFTENPSTRILAVSSSSPYVARNLAASRANGDVLLFTEPGCIPDADWVAAHVAQIQDEKISICVGHLAAANVTRSLELLTSYENVRDAWVFSNPDWRYYFGRPRNMAITRRSYQTHGPFAEVMRGADSALVQKVAREVSCEEIGHAPRAIVRMAAIRGLPSCFRDRFDHARALRIHLSSHSAPIPFSRRVRLFMETVESRRHGLITRGIMLAILGAGVLTFRAGGVAGEFANRVSGRSFFYL